MISNFYTADELPPVLSVEKMGAFLGIGRNKAYELAHSGQIDVIRIGRKILVPRHALLSYLGVLN